VTFAAMSTRWSPRRQRAVTAWDLHLLEGCRAELRRRGVRYCSIGVVEANTRAIELYERLGFQPFVRSMLARIDESS
jgi:GNAT superfamily N-acetyltransferase